MVLYLSIKFFSDSKATKPIDFRDFYLDVAAQDRFLDKIKNGELFDWMEAELSQKGIHFKEAWILLYAFDLHTKTWIGSDDLIHFKRK